MASMASERGQQSQIQSTRTSPDASTGPRTRARELHIVDVEDVPVRVLEPGGFEISHHVNVAFKLKPRHVVMLKGNVLPLQRLDDRIQLTTDAPGGRGCLVRAGEFGFID